ncbi:Isoaspartate(D-aspartate) O-methyltransferase [Fulvia fulva]|uniref:Protein-L-isoaspartate O-methyltransferase n=1 Tax=Passalora fulva TaxID=5499 RepID=A0A9Q8UV31_PASFU|nr:Isoaspartate(D-aspartate) O-methyltransferase [Fulvia fulva]KAK4611712.1 Isoaspartate(D-aspartate) O-methyltransferase [Fulvia fulva]KAK4613000.1 Isoaspartate(D-aspartate) O-methyltransferase [Fulvia fulva]UJO23427.1 Isoaspartate(D-aspartate) O-methyltransferase [Fulvia fulva]WPV21239.1 Isoaspartate(D-aspartate) O-methyltransferase [Fulvia fulva]WPV36262.1 Isoaspartate(D-aspartate) O-methyltransferase [Fulvia fulva]
MAWRSSGSTNTSLIDNLFANGLITSERVATAMKSVDRAHYAPAAPYQDSPQTIGHRATISAPHMHANAAESLLPYLQPGAKVLDVGSGSGYLTHVLAELVKPGGVVVGIEHIQPLVDMAISNTSKSQEGRDLLQSGAIKYVKGDGRLGWEQEAPYDAIHVGAAAAGHQERLIEQLKKPGRLFIPVEDEKGEQSVWVVEKDEEGKVDMRKEYGVRYVPLTDAPEG